MPLAEGSFKVWIYLGFIVGLSRSSRPRFDTSTDMRKVLIPPDAEVDSVIFRLRATDEEPDFPLIFNVTATVIPVVRIENLPCTLYNKVCQANVILTRRLSPGKFYDFLVVVRDSKGENNSMQATISVTNGTTPRSKIFLHKPSLIMVPEDAKPSTELDYLIVQSNPWSNKPVYIELWQPKDLFKIIQRQTERQTQGIITLIGELDFETQSMHTLTMYATDPYTEINYDTRNIVGLQVVVIVQDVQDVPPIFTLAPPLTKINNTIQPGDVILRVHAEDGDKGVPREVTYGLVSEYNPFTTFFNINETSGEISLARPLEELAQITRVGTPILLSVVAEEIRHSWNEPPAQATVVEIGVLLGEPENNPPYFESDNYICYIEENADPGTTLQFANPNATKVKDDDIGKAGVFTLKLVNNNGTFEIVPSVAERSANFIITVRDNTLLDYELYKTLSFKIFAKEVGPMTNLSATAQVTVFLKDVNDNPPEFDQPVYEVSLSENATVGTRVFQVHATDKDTGIFASIRYSGISGFGSEAFAINSENGWITVTAKSDALDREKRSKLELSVEARDEDGKGLKSTTKLIVHLLDVNDNAPIFEKELYEFRLNFEMTNFSSSTVVKAIDADAEPPNNEVRYEIIHGNYENKFKLDEITGELFVQEQIRKARHAKENEMRNLALELIKEHRFPTVKLSSNRKHFIMTESIENLKKNQPEYETNLIPKVRVKRADEKPLFTLTIRAYDLGVPLMSSIAQVHILHGIAPGARIVTFVMPGEQLDPNKAAETLATITGSRVTIQEIRPYIDNQRNQSGPTNSNKRSIIVARVEQTNSETLVDIEKIRKNLAANGVGVISGMDGMHLGANGISKTDESKSHTTNITNEEVTVYKAENKLLTWLLIIFGLLLLLAIAAVILCCICPGCPFYMEPRKRRIHSSETLIVRSDGRQKRHHQKSNLRSFNGLWSDKNQAWSEQRNWQFNKRNTAANYGLNSLPGDIAQVTDVPMMRNAGHTHTETIRVHKEQGIMKRRGDDKIFLEDIEGENRTFDMDSMRQHEYERGSDVQKSYQHADDREQQLDNDDDTEIREQHYYRDGNAEILRLVTRGHHQIPPKHAEKSYIGKDILLQRFIEDQKLRKENPETETGSIDIQLRSTKEVIQPEIILIPGSLNQRHLENLRSDIQQLIIDRSDYGDSKRVDIEQQKHPRDVEPGVPSIEVTRAAEKMGSNEKIMQQLHDIELVRQNTLLTRLLLERETKAVGALTTDVASYLETQSLPGQVAIATQTDRTTATQTDCRLRSRSDNESEEDSKFKRKFKFKKRYIDEDCPHRVKSIWMKSPVSEKSRTYIGIKMAARRRMAEISNARKAISPVVLQEISESLNGHEQFSSNLEEEDDEDDRLFHYCRDPIKATKIEVRKETIEISTSSQEEMEHRIATISQHRNYNTNVSCSSTKCKKMFPIEPSFRVLEGEKSSPRKKMRKLDERRVIQKGDLKKVSNERSKKTNKEMKVREIKSTVDATISKILGAEKKSRNNVRPVEFDHKLRKPMRHQQAIKADSGSSELDDLLEIRPQFNIAGPSSEYKHTVSSVKGLKKVAIYTDLSKVEKSPVKKSTSPAKKLIKNVDTKNESQKQSPVKKLPHIKKVKSSSELSKLESKSEKPISEVDAIKTKRKAQKEESARGGLNVEHSATKSKSASNRETESRSQIVPLTSDDKLKSKVKSIPKSADKLILKSDSIQTCDSKKNDEKTDKEKVICVMDEKKASIQVITDKRDQDKCIEQSQKKFKELKDESSTDNGDNDSYKEILYTRFDDEKLKKENNKDSETKKAVFQKQEQVIGNSEEEMNIEKEEKLQIEKYPVPLKRQFTDDFTKTLTEMETQMIDTNLEQQQDTMNAESKHLSCVDENRESYEQEDNDVILISETVLNVEKNSNNKQTLKTEASDSKVSQEGDQLSGHEGSQEVKNKSPKVERSNKITLDSISSAAKETFNVDYDSESSDESDLSCKTMLNRHSLEEKNRIEEILFQESTEIVKNLTLTEEKELQKNVIDDTKMESANECEKTTTVIGRSKISNKKVGEFHEDKRRPINVPEKEVYCMEKPSKAVRSIRDTSESKEKDTKSEMTKKRIAEKEQQKSKSQIEQDEQNKKDKSSRKEDDKNPSKNFKVEKNQKIKKSDVDTDKKTEKSPGRMKVPETRSRYMAWYTEKREEMERKRQERMLLEEEEQRPRWARQTTTETTPQSRRKVKPLINVESEQLKAIVRQGRKLRRGRPEDPSVQIFLPERTPPFEVSMTPRHHLVQHSEYKYERAPPPFYLHPPPAPHPSPEHCPDCPIQEDDIDSGIAVSLSGITKLRHQQLLEKKSVFDIAYSEASPTKLCSDSSTPPPS